jgi:hypothetical protein
MNKDLLIIEMIFVGFLLINVFIKNHLSIKLLFIALLFFYILKAKPDFVYNKSKFNFISYGLLIFSVLFLLLNYITSLLYVTILFCFLVLFVYLKYVLFRYSFGTVIKKNKQLITIKVEDPFYNKKTIELITRKSVTKNDIVIFSLKNIFLQKSKQKVISIIKK